VPPQPAKRTKDLLDELLGIPPVTAAEASVECGGGTSDRTHDVGHIGKTKDRFYPVTTTR